MLIVDLSLCAMSYESAAANCLLDGVVSPNHDQKERLQKPHFEWLALAWMRRHFGFGLWIWNSLDGMLLLWLTLAATSFRNGSHLHPGFHPNRQGHRSPHVSVAVTLSQPKGSWRWQELHVGREVNANIDLRVSTACCITS